MLPNNIQIFSYSQSEVLTEPPRQDACRQLKTQPGLEWSGLKKEIGDHQSHKSSWNCLQREWKMNRTGNRTIKTTNVQRGSSGKKAND